MGASAPFFMQIILLKGVTTEELTIFDNY